MKEIVWAMMVVIGIAAFLLGRYTAPHATGEIRCIDGTLYMKNINFSVPVMEDWSTIICGDGV